MFTRTRFMLVLSILLVASFLLGACQPQAATEVAPAPTEAVPVVTEAVAAPAEEAAPATTRKGGWLDEIVFTAIPEDSAGLTQLQAGAIDIYPVSMDNANLFTTTKEDPNLRYILTYGASKQMLVNVVQCTDTALLNPFSNMKIREAMQWALDRDYVIQEIMGGLGTPKYTQLSTAFPDYARYAPIVGQLAAQYKFNLDKAKEVVNAEMAAMGATLGADGKWQFNDKPVVVIGIIRTEDKRKDLGDYFANQLEQLGFTVDRQYKVRAEAAPIWTGPVDTCVWNYYTAGWISTAVTRDEGNTFAQYNATIAGNSDPIWLAYEPSPEFLDALTKLNNNDFSTMEERRALFATALPLSLTEAWQGVWVTDDSSFSPIKSNLEVASDLAGGVAATAFWPLTMKWAGQEGGTVKIAQSGIMVQPYNPIGGSNWIDDSMILRATSDSGAVSDPYTGLYLPQRIEKAEVLAVEGLPIVKSLDWVDLKFQADPIAVPTDAWADWDAKAQKFITVGEKFPEGLTSKSKTTVYYPSSLWQTKWHDGSTLSMGDFILHMLLSWDLGKPDSKIYDETYAPQVEAFMAHFKGLKIVSTDPLVIETYDDMYALDAENMAGGINTWYPSDQSQIFTYQYGTAAWHNLTPAILAEENGELAFSESKSLAKEIEWTNMVAGPSLEVQKKYLDQAQTDSYIPYAPTMSQYVTAEEAAARYANLQQWYTDHNHLWVGTGPYYLDKAFPVEATITLKYFADYPDMADRWAGFGKPMLASAVVEGPGIVKVGEEAAFDVTITFEDLPYPNAKLESVTYWVTDATGALVVEGNAEAVEDGKYTVVLPTDITAKLTAGSNKLSVAVSSKAVSIPAFATVEFVTQ